MIRVSKTFVIFFVASALMVSSAHAAVEFTARLTELPRGSQPLSGKIFVKGEKIRQETFGPNGVQIMIFRPDMKVTWMMFIPGKVCLQMPYVPSDNEFGEWASLKSINVRFLGKETFRGIECRKYQTVEDGQKTFYWISEQLSFPVKVESRDETMECTDIRRCKLEDSLFEVPATYKKTITRIAPPKE
ncbi:MAG: hypothetical protein M0Z81_09120 [Deltaproteobacteria bacterium]|jgi:hypothetical protein|nr:hypothetical protein [Deltaproteobacteria bacterium]